MLFSCIQEHRDIEIIQYKMNTGFIGGDPRPSCPSVEQD